MNEAFPPPPSPHITGRTGWIRLLRVYPAVGAISMHARAVFRFDVWVGATVPFLRVILAWLLWRALFTSREEIAGFTFNGMVAYSVLTAFLSRLDQSSGLVFEYAEDIREGRFTRYLTKPINPFGHFMMTAAARTLYVFGIAVGSVLLLTLLPGPRAFIPQKAIHVLMALLISLVGLVFLAALNWLTAILAWKFKDITGFHLIKGTVVELLAGSFLPLSLFSENIQHLMRLFPFYYVQYLPASLFLGHRTEEAGTGLIILFSWTILLVILGEISWRRLRLLDEGAGA